jgi:hypothetical protein
MSRKKNTKPTSITYTLEQVTELVRSDAGSRLGVPRHRVEVNIGDDCDWTVSATPEPGRPIGPFIDLSDDGRLMVVLRLTPKGDVLVDDPFFPAGTYQLTVSMAQIVFATPRHVLSEYERLKIEKPADLDRWVGGWSREKLNEYLSS